MSFGNAADWAKNVSNKYGASKVNHAPSVGSIAQWNAWAGFAQKAGHVAYVEEVGPDYIKVSDDSYGGGTASRIIPVGHAYWPSNFLHLTDPGASAPDSDADGTPDATDLCPVLAGDSWFSGCRQEWVESPSDSRADVSGDGKADFCRRVGGPGNWRMACSYSTGSGFSQSNVSPPLDWGYDAGRAWTDVNGDGRADFCRVVGNSNGIDSRVQCTLSAGTSFGGTLTSGVLDWGYVAGRAWADFNGDGKSDYCRLVGAGNNINSHFACTLSTGVGFGNTVLSPVTDWGYPSGQAFVDVTGDGRADFCRVVGNTNFADSRLACTTGASSGVGPTIISPILDWGYDQGRTYADVNGDGRADYCRLTGIAESQSFRCRLGGAASFGADVGADNTDWGYAWGRAFADANGDGKADFCRVVGDQISNQAIRCRLSTGTGFITEIGTDHIDWGYTPGRAWIDVNGDNRADYCRRVGIASSQGVTCRLSTGTGFSAEAALSGTDWGYDTGRTWVGSSIAAHTFTVVTRSSSALVAGQRATITATVRRSGTAIAAPGVHVLVYRKMFGSTSWTVAATLTTNAAGQVKLATAPTANTYYYARTVTRGGYFASASPTTSVSAHRRVTLRVSSSSVRAGTTVTFAGSVLPSRSALTVSLQRLAGGKWTTVVVGRTTSAGTYSLRWRPTSTADYAWRVVAAADATHLSGVSPSLVLRVS
jgi:hypothetical protein